MRRLLVVLALFFLFAPFTLADEKKITIRWFGQSYFQIVSSAGTKVIIDPHLIESYPRAINPADLVLITHNHVDHNQLDAIENKDRAKILLGCKGMGRKQEWNPIDEEFKDIHVRTVGLYHDKSQGMERGKNSAFVLEIDGLRIVHLGDVGHILTDAQVKAIGPVDILMIPVGGTYTINGSDAKKVVEQLRPTRLILPMHYGTKVFEDLVGPEEFLDEQQNVDKLLTSNEIQVPVDAKPAAPRIILLGWKKGE
ncbi:MAG TPA: MBL fold metallo-hydrolase [Gemmataceae bacterium]|jgi:L-ascorbate metabolism protein UlaG (beta-lactamase superfamily)|nr:MBL fold metallo-hydrolase [Gemmataceae bacterium]